MAGGTGNDTYVVDNAGDVVTENAGEGTDTVNTALGSYSLAASAADPGLANVENLTYTGAGNFTGTGNDLNNDINGGGGNDTLDGGTGVDTMAGGAGNDSYFVDNAGDVVTENSERRHRHGVHHAEQLHARQQRGEPDLRRRRRVHRQRQQPGQRPHRRRRR